MKKLIVLFFLFILPYIGLAQETRVAYYAGLGVPIDERKDLLKTKQYPAITVSVLWYTNNGYLFGGLGMEFNTAFPYWRGDTLIKIIRQHYAQLMGGVSIPAGWEKAISGSAIGFMLAWGTKNGTIPAPNKLGIFIQENFNFNLQYKNTNLRPAIFLRQSLSINFYDRSRNYSGLIEGGFKWHIVDP